MFVEFNGKKPQVAEGAFIAPTATLIGDVVIEEGASIWFGAVLRADFGRITIGKGTSVQDNSVVHVLPGGETSIGEDVTVGHGVVVHNCKVGNGSIIGMNVVLLDFCEIGEQAMIAAGSVVTDGSKIPPRHLAAGAPAKVKKEIDGNSLWWVQQSPSSYKELARQYMNQDKLKYG